MSSTTTVAIDTISHLHVVSNYSKMLCQYGTVKHKQMQFHIFCGSSVISTDIGYYDNSSHWALSSKLGKDYFKCSQKEK